MTLAFQLGLVCVALAITTDWSQSQSQSRTMEREEDMPTPIDNPTPEIKKRQPKNNKGSKKKKCIMGREISKLEKIKEADRTNTDP
ncbi:hypothetical protein ACFX13_039715 [Malus domestica]